MLKFRFQLCVGPLTVLVFQNACLFLFRELSRDFPSSAWEQRGSRGTSCVSCNYP